MKFILFSLAIINFVLPCSASETLASTADRQLWIENLPDAVAAEFEGCSCSFSSRTNDSSTAIAWNYGEESPKAAMRINGRTERLTFVGEKSYPKRSSNQEPQMGDTTEYKFADGSTSTTLNCKVSQTCWKEPGCEYIGYGCSAKVLSAGRRVTFPVVGGCGC